MSDEFRLILTSEGQDPSHFKIDLNQPLDLNEDWRVSLYEIDIPSKLMLLSPSLDGITILKDETLEEGDRHIHLVNAMDEVWSNESTLHTLLNVAKNLNLSPEHDRSLLQVIVDAIEQKLDSPGNLGTAPEDPSAPRSIIVPPRSPAGTDSTSAPLTTLTSGEDDNWRPIEVLDMSRNGKIYSDPYLVLSSQLEKTMKKGKAKSRYYFDEITRKGIFFIANNERIILGGQLPYIMSMPKLLRSDKIIQSEYCVDIFQNNRTVYVYSDLGKVVKMGESVYPFLQAFSAQTEERQMVFHKQIFLPIEKHHITSISISLRNEVGKKLKFGSSSPLTVCKLLFRRFSEQKPLGERTGLEK